MIHHLGEVVEVFRPSDKDVKSSDNDTLATVRMWDENMLTLVVDSKISPGIKNGDMVLVDYRPLNLGSATKPALVQKQLVTKIIKSDRGNKIMREYKRWHGIRKERMTQQTSSDYMG